MKRLDILYIIYCYFLSAAYCEIRCIFFAFISNFFILIDIYYINKKIKCLTKNETD